MMVFIHHLAHTEFFWKKKKTFIAHSQDTLLYFFEYLALLLAASCNHLLNLLLGKSRLEEVSN
jgi:hypothetical protein